MDQLATTPVIDRLESGQQQAAPVFGLRYLEEEAAEINSVVGCLVPVDDGGVGTYYMSGCDSMDYD